MTGGVDWATGVVLPLVEAGGVRGGCGVIVGG